MRFSIKKALVSYCVHNYKTLRLVERALAKNRIDFKCVNREMLTNKGDKILEMHSVYVANFAYWQNFNAVLVGEKDVDPAPFYATNLEYLKQARDYVWNSPERFERISEYALPNGQKLFLMRIN